MRANYRSLAGSLSMSVVTLGTGLAAIAQPAITFQPQPVRLAPGDDAAFVVGAADGACAGELQYRWYRSLVLLTDGPTGNGSAILGAASPMLRVSNVGPDDLGSYIVQVSNSCGDVFSSDVLLSFFQPCGSLFEEFPVGTTCTGTGQLCENTFDVVADTCGPLTVEYIAASTHCSRVGMRFFLDGALAYESSTLGPGESTGAIDLGPVASGPHALSLEAVGETGGCNNGYIETWAGTLRMNRCSISPSVSGPDSTATCSSGAASFAVSVSGTGPYVYQWQREATPGAFIPLADGSTSSWDGDSPDFGAIVSGAATTTLTIAAAPGKSLSSAHSVAYRCTITNSCGGETSARATFLLCIADMDDGIGAGVCDGGVGIEDLLYYLVIYNAGVTRADVDDGSGTGTRDGGVGIEDLLYFLTRYNAGC